jgi:hypothetical protein
VKMIPAHTATTSFAGPTLRRGLRGVKTVSPRSIHLTRDVPPPDPDYSSPVRLKARNRLPVSQVAKTMTTAVATMA